MPAGRGLFILSFRKPSSLLSRPTCAVCAVCPKSSVLACLLDRPEETFDLPWMGGQLKPFFFFPFPCPALCGPEMIAKYLMHRTQSSRVPPGFDDSPTVLRSEGSVPPSSNLDGRMFSGGQAREMDVGGRDRLVGAVACWGGARSRIRGRAPPPPCRQIQYTHTCVSCVWPTM